MGLGEARRQSKCSQLLTVAGTAYTIVPLQEERLHAKLHGKAKVGDLVVVKPTKDGSVQFEKANPQKDSDRCKYKLVKTKDRYSVMVPEDAEGHHRHYCIRQKSIEFDEKSGKPAEHVAVGSGNYPQYVVHVLHNNEDESHSEMPVRRLLRTLALCSEPVVFLSVCISAQA